MTHRIKELEELGVHPIRVAVRRWRRERGLTIRSMADMIGVTAHTLQNWETGRGCEQGGRPRNTSLTRAIEAFMDRWEKVPEVQEQIAQEVHRSKLRYRAAALARCRQRGYEVPDGQCGA